VKPLAATSKSLELGYPSRILEEEEVEVGVRKMGGQGSRGGWGSGESRGKSKIG